MKAAGMTDPGRNRENNEDFIHLDVEHGIFLLADGMGGHQAGEVASQLAVSEAAAYLTGGVSLAKTSDDLNNLLAGAVYRAHDAIRSQGEANLHLQDMGTTLVEMVVRHRKAYIMHVGDSRAYLLRETLRQLTRDHNLGALLLEQGVKKEMIPPKRFHALTRAVGIGDDPVPDWLEVDLEDGDLLLLCSDGLTDMLEDDEIEEILRDSSKDLDQLAAALVQAANDQGGRDNISVILVRYENHITQVKKAEEVLPVTAEDGHRENSTLVATCRQGPTSPHDSEDQTPFTGKTLTSRD